MSEEREDFFLMDLERTLQSGAPCFWKQSKHGYTYKIEHAGIFPEHIAQEIVKHDRDKMTVAIPAHVVQKILGEVRSYGHS